MNSDVAVVLLDRRIPGISGDDVLKTIRERGIDCRVVMVTGVAPGTGILDVPFDEYLVKPVSRDDVRDAVSKMLVRASYDESVQEIVATVSKMATLESKLTLSEMEDSPKSETVPVSRSSDGIARDPCESAGPSRFSFFLLASPAE